MSNLPTGTPEDEKVFRLVQSYLTMKRPSTESVDMMYQHQHRQGKRPKRVIDKARSNNRNNYYLTGTIQNELLKYYENIDWWERTET